MKLRRVISLCLAVASSCASAGETTEREKVTGPMVFFELDSRIGFETNPREVNLKRDGSTADAFNATVATFEHTTGEGGATTLETVFEYNHRR